MSGSAQTLLETTSLIELLIASKRDIMVYDFLLSNPVVVVVTLSLLLAGRVAYGQRKWNQIKHSLDFDSHFTTNKEIISRLKIVAKIPNEKILQHAKDSSSKDGRSISYLLNTLERMSVSMKKGILHESTLYDIYSTLVINVWMKLYPYISHQQKDNFRVFNYFTYLVVRWSRKRKLHNDGVLENDLSYLIGCYDYNIYDKDRINKCRKKLDALRVQVEVRLNEIKNH